jgi:uncharacterized protein with GYD domain
MPTYVALLRWTQEGIENVKDSPSRYEKAKEALQALGGDFKAFYLTIGAYDMVAICEAPDDRSLAKFLLSVGATGSIRTETLRAFTEEEYRDIELPSKGVEIA